jgi:hypothetical protein
MPMTSDISLLSVRERDRIAVVSAVSCRALDEVSNLYSYLQFRINATLAGVVGLRPPAATAEAASASSLATGAYLDHMGQIVEAASRRIVRVVEEIPASQAGDLCAELVARATEVDQTLGTLVDVFLGKHPLAAAAARELTERVEGVAAAAKQALDRQSDEYLRQWYTNDLEDINHGR